MADIRLAKPVAGAAETVPCAPEARFVFDFPATDATLARDGDDLAIQFGDGSRLTLEGFYTEYNEENLPSFSIDGAEVAAADFFAAMNEPDLMPAAGPGAGTPTGGRFHEYADADLAGGLEHLDGLDLTTGRAFAFDDARNAVGGAPGGDSAALADAAAPGGGTTLTPGTEEPETPAPDHPVSITGAAHTLYEKHLANGSEAKPDALTAEGSLSISAPDGVASIMVEFGGARMDVPVNGASVSFAPGGHPEGSLTLRYDADAGKLEYSYTLTQATQEHAQEGQDERLSHDFTVTVTDTDGDSESGVIRVTIEDDAPTLQLDQTESGHYGQASVIGSLSRNYGADGEAAAGSLSLLLDGTAASRTDDGMFTFDGIGTIKIESNGDLVFTPVAGSGAEASHTLSVTITDGDNDPATDTISFSVAGTDTGSLKGHAESSDADRTAVNDVTVEGLPDGAALVDGIYHGTYGTITVKDGAISYVQDKKTFDHREVGEERAGKDVATGADQISVHVRLGDGSEASFTVSVDITDDIPYGGSVSHSVGREDVIEGNIFAPEQGSSATTGADGLGEVKWKLPDGWEWTEGDASATSGKAWCAEHPDALLSVTLNSDGTYTFTALGNVGGIGGSIAFDHIIYDKDGDWSEGKLDFNPSDRNDVPDVPPLPAELEVTVREAALPEGSDPSLDDDGKPVGASVSLDIPAGYEIVQGGAGAHGSVVRNEDGSWSYKLSHAVTNALNEDRGRDTVSITLKDGQGNEHTVDVKVSIIDDAPVIAGDEEATVDPATEALFPDGTFDFTLGNHETFTKYDNTMLGDGPLEGWKNVWGDDWSVPPSAQHSSGLIVYGGMYTYTEPQQDGYRELTMEKPLSVFFSGTERKYGDHESVSQGKQDGLSVGEEMLGDGSYSSFEIGAKPGENTAEGICFDLQGQTAHLVTVNLGAFFSAGSGNDWGQTYDPVSERALLTFFDKDGKIVKQMEVEADSKDGLYTESINCYVAGGFSSFVVSALDNNKEGAIPKADSDFVVQSVEFHKIIGTTAGKLGVKPGADGPHADMLGYAALFALDTIQAKNPGLTFEADGPDSIIARAADGKIIFAAEIDKDGEWTLTQFNHFDGAQDITLAFTTTDGDGDSSTETVQVHLYPGENPAVADAMHTDAHDHAALAAAAAEDADAVADGDEAVSRLAAAMDDPADDDGVPLFTDADAGVRTDSGDVFPGADADDALVGGAASDLLVYDANDYLIDGGENIDFLLTDQNVSLKDLDNVENVEVLLKGGDALSLTRMEELADKYGIRLSEDGGSMTLVMGEKNGWSQDANGVYTHHDADGNVDLTMETANLTIQEPASAEAEQAAQTLTLSAQG